MYLGERGATLKAFTHTDLSGVSPLTLEQITTVPGVLGQISLERLLDYNNTEIEPLDLNVPQRPSFYKALQGEEVSVIAEVKRASPSLGTIADLNPVEAACAYWRGGAAALSILTEPRHFSGQLAHLEEVAGVAPLPLLRKDFTVHPAQLIEAKRAGASAVLLIVAVLGEHLKAYLDLAERLELDALVEVHDEAELDLALSSSANIIGVNNRDLRTLEINLGNAPNLIQKARGEGFDGLLVAESGYSAPEQIEGLRGAADAVLVGSSVAGSGDLEGAIRHLRGAA